MRAVVICEQGRIPHEKLLRSLLLGQGHNLDDMELISVLDEGDKPGKRVVRNAGAALTGYLEEKTEDTAVLLIGNLALEAVTGKKGIKQKRGRPWQENHLVYLPIMSPGTVLYDERTRPLLESDCRLFAEILEQGQIPRERELEWTIVENPRQFQEMLDDLKGTVSFDIETTGLYPWDKGAQVVSIGFGTSTRQWCLPLNHHEAKAFWPSIPSAKGWGSTHSLISLTSAQCHAEMFRLLDERMQECYLVAHNGKFDSLWLRVHYGINWQVDFDTMLAHWMLDENQRHGLKLLAQMYLGAPNYDADLDTKQGIGPIHSHCLYLAHDVFYTRALRFVFAKEFDKDPQVLQSFELLVMPIARLFVDIEFTGVAVDYDRFEEAEVHLNNLLTQAEKDLHKAIAKEVPGYKPGDINWKSPKQIGKLFFETLGLDIIEKTDTGAASTSESVLKRIKHPAAEALLRYRGADQQKKMFIEGWKPFLVLHEDGVWRLHPSFKLHGTVTGRASCEHPNLQQVPRDPLIRSLIIATFGWELVDMDLSQIEMRIAAELSGDPVLLDIFDRDADVHWKTALEEINRGTGMVEEVIGTATAWVLDASSQDFRKKHGITIKRRKSGERVCDLTYGQSIAVLHHIGPDVAVNYFPVWKELRKKAKAINFGYLFGMWWRKMIEYARDNYGVHLTEEQAQQSRESFFDTYAELGPWHKRQQRYAKRHGFVRSLTGAKRRLPEAQSERDSPQRGEALRQAINSPVQRFACELNYMVLLQLVEEFGLNVIRPIGTVHDAILAEIRCDRIEQVYNRALEIQQGPKLLQDFNINLRVPIKGDAKIGPWSLGVTFDKYKSLVAAGKTVLGEWLKERELKERKRLEELKKKAS